MKRYRIKSKVRFTVFMLIVMFVIMTLLGAALPGLAVDASKVTYKTVEVEYGDTLWAIAGKYKPDGRDVRSFVYEIKDINGLDDSGIYAGQKLLVPVV
ncbi:MAG: LysM peptidoglycan-binding domain-containing protein [Eubacterium sp.]|nr:LysM peptidoglycan-binding domain-containing protein [Eubacterium sp.]